MKAPLILLITILLVCSGCKSEIESTMEGWWTLDIVEYNGQNIQPCLLSNSMNFNKDGSLELPPPLDICTGKTTFMHGYRVLGNWQILSSPIPSDTIPLRVKFQTNESLYNGEHKLVFHDDTTEKLLKIEVWSDSLYFVASKGLFNHDKNLSTIKRLEAKSWLTRP